MAESTRQGRRRARRSTRVSRELEAARKRNAEQLAAQRRQEEAVEAALAEFFVAGDEIAAADEDCRRRVEPHERAIAQLRQERDARVASQEQAQGLAALAIHEADRTVEQVGELLGLGEKPARRLIAAGREARAQQEPQREPNADVADEDGTPSAAEIRRDEGVEGDPRGEHVAVAPEGAGAASSGGGGWPAGPVGDDGGDEPAQPAAPGAVSA
jgi:hypothetical protein